MFHFLLDSLKKLVKSRLFPIAAIYVILFCILFHRIFYLQVIEGEEYAEETEANFTDTRYINSTRGNIYDRKGVLLAYNDLAYAVTLEDVGFASNEACNTMIHKMIQIIEENGGTLASEFCIEKDEDGKFIFNVDKTAELRFKMDIYFTLSVNELEKEQAESTAKEVFEYLHGEGKTSANFEIDEKYTDEEALKIMNIRYAMLMNRNTRYNPIIVAHNVDNVTVAAIKENKADLPGVDITQESYRIYENSEIFAHILGYTGRVPDETLQELKGTDKEGTYTDTDQIGKTGLEKRYEEYLHGKNGKEVVTTNIRTSRVISVDERIEPVAGNDLYLTIDSKLQEACYKLLERNIAGILLSTIVNSTDVGTKGVSANNITIPIYDVYFSFIDNNVIDITRFNSETATKTEKKVYQTYLEKREEVFQQLDNLLSVTSKITNSDTSEEMAEYLDYVYQYLINNEIIIKNAVLKEDDNYISYQNDQISLSTFLQYAISNNWIDLSRLNIGEEYYTTEELYQKLIEYTKENLEKDNEFNKMLYRYLIYSYDITGTQICVLLFDQGVLQYDEGQIANLENGIISAYSFIMDKIRNLEITPAQIALKPCSGAVVVTDTSSGEVLACVSYPGYDNNKFANSVNAKYASYVYESDASYSVFRPTQTRIAPGSTFKPLTAIAALEEGVITTDTLIQDKGYFTEIKPSPKCYIYPSSHGMENVTNAIRDSCNYFFFETGWKLGQVNGNYNSDTALKKIKKYAKMFGFDHTSGIELTEYDPTISDFDAIRSAIGHGHNSYTPSQLSKYVTTIATRGTCYNLTIINRIEDLNGDIVLKNEPSIYNELQIKDSTWNAVQEGMYRVVNAKENSISRLFENVSKKVKVAGKTGTAQINVNQPNHGLFISYAPFENPEISVTAVIPNGHKSSNAVELARDVYMYYFNIKGQKDLDAPASQPELDGSARID